MDISRAVKHYEQMQMAMVNLKEVVSREVTGSGICCREVEAVLKIAN
jgi:hypothetical protein